MSFLFISKHLRLNSLRTRTTMNAKICVFVICVEAIMCLLLYNLQTVPLKWRKPFSSRKAKLYISRIITCDVLKILHNFAEYCVQELKKTLPLREVKKAQATVNRERAERDNNILFNNLWVFDMFVLLPAIMQYLYDSV